MKIKGFKEEIETISNVIEKFNNIGLDYSKLSGGQISLFKEFSEQELQSYIDKIQEIQEAVNEIFANSPEDQQGLDIGQYEEFANALEGVEDSQAAILLSTQGLTNAQIQQTLSAKGLSTELQYQAMVEAGLLGTKQKLSNVELQSILASQLGSEAKAKEIMTSMGLSVAIEGEEVQTVKLTAKKLEQAIADGILTKEEAQLLAMTTGVTIAQNAQVTSTMPKWIASMKAMALATWEQVKATVAWLATTPAGWATLAIGGIVGVITAISKHNKKAEEAKQKIKELGEEARNASDEIKSNFESTKSTVDEVADKYAELAQGVKNLGKASQSQGTLSNDEYSEFLDLSNQLAELFPRLTTGYDDNGNAILNLNGNVQNITSSIYSYIDAMEAANSIELQNKFDDIWADYDQNIEYYNNKREDALQKVQDLKDTQYALGEEGIILNDYTKEIFDKAGLNIYDYLGQQLSDLDPNIQGKLNDAFALLIEQYQQEAEYATTQVESINKNTANYLISSLQGDDVMKSIENNLGTAGINIANAILSNINYAEQYKGMSGAEILEAVKKDYLFAISKLEGEDKQQFQDAWNNLLSIDTDAALAENIPKIEAYIKQLAELLNIDWTQLAPALGYDLEADKQSLNTAKDRFATTETRTYGSGDHQYTRDTQVNNEVADKWINGLSEDDLNFIATIDKIDIDETAKFKTEEEFQEWLDKLKEEAGVIEVRTALDTATDLKTTDDAFQKLGSGKSGLYADTKSGKHGSASDIEGLTESFKDVSGGFALESFANTLEKLPGDAQAAQEAFDDLTTAYLDQSNVLDDITEANKDYIIEQLKTQGIENAEAFVLSRLNSQVKKNIKAVNEYSTAVSSYSKTLLSVQKGEDGYDDALEEMRTNFEELYNSINDFKDEQGNKITIPISTDFAEKNLQDLIDLANGSTDALERLQFAAAKEYITHIGVDLPTDQYNAVQQQMNSLMDEIQSNIQDVKVGAYLDNTAAIKALSDLILASNGTAKDVNNVLSQMGVDAEVQYEDITMEMSGTGGAGDHEYKYNYTHRAKIPKSVKYIKKPVSGVGAHYTGTSNGSSSGGSGGGGGGSSSDTQKDPTQFDWIETAITRAEESISRLDKVIDNTYQNWLDRNIAVVNKIKQVSNEIDLQKKAYQGYMNKANSIGLADVYKQKVQNGAIQIEDIADENLVKKIENYKNWYEKAIACKDAIKDLNTTLSDLAKMRFDNVVKQFEEIEQVFTDANDLIQKRLEYAEERGMIASKAYYQGMIANSKKNRQHLAKQLTRMQEELNKGVASGSIKKGSEEWYSMTQEIEKTKQAIVETDTEIQKFANDIRQVDWDIFDLGQEMISNVIDETDFLNSLIEKRDNLTDGTKSRGLTNDGIALLGTHSSNYNMYMAKNQEYAKKIKEINNQLAKDPTNQDLINQKDEYIKAQRESILAAEDEKQAMIDLARQGYDAVLANMQELIDKRKEYLNQEKSIYEYQKNISEQTKNIASLRKQLAVYENDNSEESRKKVQQLKVSIQEAEQNLKDTEYDKYISDQEEMLDKIYQDYSDTIDEKFENIDSLFKELISIVNKFDNNIQNTLYHTAQDAGYNLSEEIKGIWSGDAKLTISSFSKNFSTYATNVQKVLSSIWNKIDYMTYVSWVDYNKQSGGTTNNQVTKQHATGLKKSTSDYLAWTQENGAEIVRTKDGALLYPVTSGTTIFTSDMTDNLWNFAKNPFEFISGIPSTISYSNHINNENNISLTIGDIKLDGVQNPEQFASQFISAMQNNSKLRKALQSGTIDLLAGKNSKRINNF